MPVTDDHFNHINFSFTILVVRWTKYADISGKKVGKLFWISVCIQHPQLSLNESQPQSVTLYDLINI